MNTVIVTADWDPEAEVWTATSRDVPGLVAEASSLEVLRPKVLSMIEDLIDEGVVSFSLQDIPVHFVASVTDTLKKPVAA
jgi:hypothetical protein